MSVFSSIRAWALEHDDRRTFVWPYFALSIAAGIFLNLFWLVALVGFHFSMELYRQKAAGLKGVVLRALWEVKLDVALVLISLAMSIYMDVVFGVLGLGRVTASLARAGGRLAVVHRFIRPVLLSLDDAVRILGALVGASGARHAMPDAPAPVAELPWSGRWALGDVVAVGLVVLSLGLLAAAPLVSGHDFHGLLRIVVDELRPIPVDVR